MGQREVRPGWVSLDALSPCFPDLSPARPSLGQAECRCSLRYSALGPPSPGLWPARSRWEVGGLPGFMDVIPLKCSSLFREAFLTHPGSPSFSPQNCHTSQQTFVHTLTPTDSYLGTRYDPSKESQVPPLMAIPLPFPSSPGSHQHFNTRHRSHPAFRKGHMCLTQNHQNCVSGLFLPPWSGCSLLP